MRVPIGCSILLLAACATRPGYVAHTTPMADDVAACVEQPCGGSGDPVTIGLAISALVGVAIAMMWER